MPPTAQTPPPLLLDSSEQLARGFAALCALDPIFGRIERDGVALPLRKRDPGLAGLLRIVVGQQVSTASAAAIWARMEAAFPAMTAGCLSDASDAALRSVGLSRPKMRTVRAVASAMLDGRLRLNVLHEQDADRAHAELVTISGVGPWTADAYLLFCLGHADAFPAGDLALQEAARLLLGLETRPGTAALADLAERWRPWRGMAAIALWALYAEAKSRTGLPVGA